MKNKMITSRDEDFAKWYTDVVNASHLATYSNVKGCVVIEPNGYAIWEKMQEVLDKMFKDWENRDNSMEIQAYKKVGIAIMSYHNWAVYRNTSIAQTASSLPSLD